MKTHHQLLANATAAPAVIELLTGDQHQIDQYLPLARAAAAIV